MHHVRFVIVVFFSQHFEIKEKQEKGKMSERKKNGMRSPLLVVFYLLMLIIWEYYAGANEMAIFA
jgi:hypothetical protein